MREKLPGHGLQDNRASLGEIAGFDEDCCVKNCSPK